MIPLYPETTEVTLQEKEELAPFFSSIDERISEFTFANIYLFRYTHNYRLSRLPDDRILITGSDDGESFFILPGGPVEPTLLEELFERFSSMKCVSERFAKVLERRGYRVTEDRDNFDYIFLTEGLGSLSGRKMHKKKNLYNRFVSTWNATLEPIDERRRAQVLSVLERWREEREDGGDYRAAKEGIELFGELGLEGSLCCIDDTPVGFILGEPHPCGDTFLVHFRKSVRGYTGIAEFVLKTFAERIKERFRYINMEQDLGREGLRQAKLGFRPTGFVKKFRAYR